MNEGSEAQQRYCAYMRAYVEDGDCIDLQMIALGLISPAALPEVRIDRERLNACCAQCYCRMK